jgi:guanylate cyclase
MTLGAIPLAVEEVNNDPNLLPGRKLQFVVADIGNPSMRLLFILDT